MKISHIIFGAVTAFTAMLTVACNEFEPVFTGRYSQPAEYEKVTMTPTHTIAQLAAMYRTGNPMEILDNVIIEGRVASSDQSGNFYRSLYIQDGTAGIELKLGKTGLYNDYRPGQTVYVDCYGLWLGMYGFSSSSSYGGSGMIQIGYASTDPEYETSYMESQYMIDLHVFRGGIGDPVEAAELSEADLPGKNDTQANNKYIGTLVTLKNLSYGDEIFTLLYVDSNQDTDASSNRVFLSGDTFNVTTWAMTESKVEEHLEAGHWDNVLLGNSSDQNYGTVADHKEQMLKNASPANVSQYFKTPGGTDIQIRTSGYSRFADTEIPAEVLSGDKTINATGILTMYQGSLQLVLLDLGGITVNE